MAVNVRDVAALAGVSVGTVSNVLNHPGKVAPDTVARVRLAIGKLGFVRNDAARQLRAGRSRSIGLIVLDVGNPFFTDLARGAERRATESNLSVLLGNSEDSAEREASLLDLFEEQRVHGVLMSPIGDVMARLIRLRERGIPAVLVDRRADDHSFCSVSVDDVAGGNLAVSHLAAIGRRRVAFVGGPQGIRQVSDRLAGARQAVKQVPGMRLEVIEAAALTVLEGRAVGLSILDRAPADRPDAIFAANDLLAVGALQVLAMNGSIRVPDDIAVIGYDDIAFASAAVVPLTSIRQPSDLIGHRAMDLLLQETQGKGEHQHEQVVFQPALAARESTGG